MKITFIENSQVNPWVSCKSLQADDATMTLRIDRSTGTCQVYSLCPHTAYQQRVKMALNMESAILFYVIR